MSSNSISNLQLLLTPAAKRPQVSTPRCAPVETTKFLPLSSRPEPIRIFPTTSPLPLPPTLSGCPSRQRMWVDKDGAKPHQSSVFSSFPSPPKLGCPTSRSFFARCGIPLLCPRSPFPADSAYPTRALAFMEEVFLLGEPHAAHQRHESKQAVYLPA